jgi:uncharacterized protein YceK
MKRLLISLMLALALSGCQSMVITYDQQGNKIKTPTSLLALQDAQTQVNDCRTAVLQSMGQTPIDTTTEAGRMHSIILAMTNKNSISMCDEIVAKVAAEYNATDRARLGMISKGIGAGGMVLGGYVIGETLAGIAAAGGSRVSINGNEVRSSGSGGGAGAGGSGGGEMGVAGGGAGGGAETGINGDSIYNVTIDSTVQQSVGGSSSLFNPNLEQAGITSPIIGEGSTFAPDLSEQDTSTIGVQELF